MGRKSNNKQTGKAMKYLIIAKLDVNGSVQRKDIIGAIMGQTEGLLGDELELRKLQRTARIGHVDVELESKGGKVSGKILIPSSMDNVETAIIGSSLETIDRIGPCAAKIAVSEIQDVRVTKRTSVVQRAKELLLGMVNSGEAASKTVIEEVRSVLTTGTATSYAGLTCGPNAKSSEAIIVVEGRNDVRNLLGFGIKNAISCDGAGDIKPELIELVNSKSNVTLAIDGDRGGEMLFRQLFEMMKVDYVAQAPPGQEWELLPQKTATKCLSNKEEASKFAHRLSKDEDKEETKNEVTKNEVTETAPAEIQEYFDQLEDLDKNHAVFVGIDGTISDPIGPKSLAKSAGESEGAVAIVFNGPVSGRTIEIASESAIENVVGQTAGKDCSSSSEVKVWLADQHQ
tara:strand:- start:1771 stop:2970 length:1200 start_codon:yes stop_codon:yes gene_type:complete